MKFIEILINEHCSEELAIAFDPSFISNSGKKTTGTGYFCSGCAGRTKWGGICIGLLSRGNIEFVTVSNCTLKDIQDLGLKIQQNEGGEISNMTFTNLDI